jgi:hypothetical protein
MPPVPGVAVSPAAPDIDAVPPVPPAPPIPPSPVWSPPHPAENPMPMMTPYNTDPAAPRPPRFLMHSSGCECFSKRSAACNSCETRAKIRLFTHFPLRAGSAPTVRVRRS